MKAELIDVVEVGNRLGEAVVWEADMGSVWWTDIPSSKLYAYNIERAELSTWDTPEKLACFAFVQGDSRILAGFESGIAYYQPSSGEVEWICKIEESKHSTRLNDGRTDRAGRFWVGTMCEQYSPIAALYSLDKDHNLRQHLTGISVSNSLCWSPDSRIVYHSDTAKQKIDAYQFVPKGPEGGGPEIGESLPFMEAKPGYYPDGSIVDSEGCLINAQWAGGRVVRYMPNGKVDSVLELPISQPTCVALGGKNRDLLFVTSGVDGLEKHEANAGDLFIYQTELKGLVEARYYSQKYSALTK